MRDIDTRYGDNTPTYLSEKLYWKQVNYAVDSSSIVINPPIPDLVTENDIPFTCPTCNTTYFVYGKIRMRECPYCHTRHKRKGKVWYAV